MLIPLHPLNVSRWEANLLCWKVLFQFGFVFLIIFVCLFVVFICLCFFMFFFNKATIRVSRQLLNREPLGWSDPLITRTNILPRVSQAKFWKPPSKSPWLEAAKSLAVSIFSYLKTYYLIKFRYHSLEKSPIFLYTSRLLSQYSRTPLSQ